LCFPCYLHGLALWLGKWLLRILSLLSSFAYVFALIAAFSHLHV
jgi:hypothetical protein